MWMVGSSRGGPWPKKTCWTELVVADEVCDKLTSSALECFSIETLYSYRSWFFFSNQHQLHKPQPANKPQPAWSTTSKSDPLFPAWWSSSCGKCAFLLLFHTHLQVSEHMCVNASWRSNRQEISPRDNDIKLEEKNGFASGLVSCIKSNSLNLCIQLMAHWANIDSDDNSTPVSAWSDTSLLSMQHYTLIWGVNLRKRQHRTPGLSGTNGFSLHEINYTKWWQISTSVCAVFVNGLSRITMALNSSKCQVELLSKYYALLPLTASLIDSQLCIQTMVWLADTGLLVTASEPCVSVCNRYMQLQKPVCCPKLLQSLLGVEGASVPKQNGEFMSDHSWQKFLDPHLHFWHTRVNRNDCTHKWFCIGPRENWKDSSWHLKTNSSLVLHPQLQENNSNFVTRSLLTHNKVSSGEMPQISYCWKPWGFFVWTDFQAFEPNQRREPFATPHGGNGP